MLRASWIVLLVLTGAALAACGTSYPNRNPVGETFPSVRGTSLSDEAWSLPDDLAGAEAILLLGYEQNTQFDIDRWLIGLDMYGVSTRILEIPTIEGLVPGLISGTIDGGMRSGIPEPVWDAVVTVYGDAPAVQEFTGNEQPNNARVLVLDPEGTVTFFHDRGFSTQALRGLLDQIPDHEIAPRLER